MGYGSPAHMAHYGGLLWAMVLASDQTLFYMYHYNSYANNPVMLRSSKPMVMRDVFLTQAKSTYPNPLSCVYVNFASDTIINSAMSGLVVFPMTMIIGVRHAIALYFGAGFFSSFAYIFSAQVNPKKLNTQYDCTCTSNGAYAGCAVISMMLPKCYIPTSKKLPVTGISAAFLARCAYDEYIEPKWSRSTGDRVEDTIELRNWGFMGGVFFALMYSSLFLRTKVDYGMMRTFYSNIAPPKSGRARVTVRK